MKKYASRFPGIVLGTLAGAVLLSAPLRAAQPIPANLASGLDELVASNVAFKQAQGSRKRVEASFLASNGQAYTTARAAEYASDATADEQGRFLVRVHLDGLKSVDVVSAAIAARVPSFEVTVVDRRYKGGVIGGYVSIDDVPALANTGGVRSVALEFPPQLNKAIREGKADPAPDVTPGQTLNKLGTAFDQGVFLHRVDTINKFYNPSAPVDYQGQGMSIGFISDSYNKLATNPIPASTDVANFDLPGASNNPVNTQPVVVLQDASAAASDEGRAMGQIVYKMAPKARIAFATGGGGEPNFARNIRALAGLPGNTYPPGTQQGFAGDVVCDDLSYGSMPFFEEGIVGQAVDDAAAAGVMYFTSAGNDIGTYDYDSDYRNIPNGTGLTAATNAALAGTNINLTNVPAAAYAGGFHNFRTDGGRDVAQTVNVITVAAGLPQTNFQWDDPYNQTIPVIQPAIYHNSGNHPGSGQQTFVIPNSLTVGTKYVLTVNAQPGSNFDAIVTLKDPNGNTVINAQDTNADETLQFTATTSQPGYTVIVESFAGTTGAYNVDLFLAAPTTSVTNDLNILVFRVDNGAYIPGSSLTANNVSSNVPQEFGRTAPPTGQTQVQYVISRSSNSIGNTLPTHLRWIIRGNGLAGIGPAEYITINTPNAGLGHRLARGCFTTAAYPVFRPSMQEYYTSPGPATVYFDATGTRFNPPDVRLKPVIAAADVASNSFFASDSTSDFDTNPNFSGTSAASPHAAAIAALVLQAKGGFRSVTPAQMMTLLQQTAFPHDLDPNYASAAARTSLGGKVSIAIAADRGLNPSSGAFNPDSISVSYVGPGSLTSLVFNPEGTGATGGAPTAGNNGLGNATQTGDGTTYFSNIYPGVIFQALPGTPGTPAAGGAPGVNSGMFVLGNSVGLTAADVTPTFTNQAPAPSVAGQFWTLNLAFSTGNFTGGKVLRFTTGHAQQHDSTVTTAGGTGPTGGVTGVNTTQADLFGGAVLLPDGTTLSQGMTFSGTTSGGGTFNGQLQNRLGKGYSVTDGFGFINAEAAVMQPVQ